VRLPRLVLPVVLAVVLASVSIAAIHASQQRTARSGAAALRAHQPDVQGVYIAQARHAQTVVMAVAAGAIALLLVAFMFVYRHSVVARERAERLAAENAELLAAARVEAITDPLTGLANRRALVGDLERLVAAARDDHPATLVVYDLDGFEAYNNTFGHRAGDALLTRAAQRLREAAEGAGAMAYRLAGDEFCLLRPSGVAVDLFVEVGIDALAETGPGYAIAASGGHAVVPADATTATEAMVVADRRLSEAKAARPEQGPALSAVA
jgi:diguanylate cyclase (GGDEF)-like protein